MRRERKNRAVNRDLSTPFVDIAKLGTEEDPCFGKHYDLNAEECIQCGEIETCSIAFLQQLKVKRLQAERNNAHLDLEMDKLEKSKQIRDFINEYIKKGSSKSLIITKARRRFKMNKDQLVLIYDELKNGR